MLDESSIAFEVTYLMTWVGMERKMELGPIRSTLINREQSFISQIFTALLLNVRL